MCFLTFTRSTQTALGFSSVTHITHIISSLYYLFCVFNFKYPIQCFHDEMSWTYEKTVIYAVLNMYGEGATLFTAFNSHFAKSASQTLGFMFRFKCFFTRPSHHLLESDVISYNQLKNNVALYSQTQFSLNFPYTTIGSHIMNSSNWRNYTKMRMKIWNIYESEVSSYTKYETSASVGIRPRKLLLFSVLFGTTDAIIAISDRRQVNNT